MCDQIRCPLVITEQNIAPRKNEIKMLEREILCPERVGGPVHFAGIGCRSYMHKALAGFHRSFVQIKSRCEDNGDLAVFGLNGKLICHAQPCQSDERFFALQKSILDEHREIELERQQRRTNSKEGKE